MTSHQPNAQTTSPLQDMTWIKENLLYVDDNGFYRLFVPEERSDATTDDVLEFYTESPFPNYNDFDDVATFIQRAERSSSYFLVMASPER